MRTPLRFRSRRVVALASVLSLAVLGGVSQVMTASAASTLDDGETRVVGGREIRDLSGNPGAVVIHGSGMQLCSGARIGPTWVLTAHHCQELPSGGKLNVDTVLTHTVEAGKGPKARVKRTIFAPSSDMMLIELEEATPGPILPWSAQPLKPGDKVSFWGWGAYDKSGKTSKWLKTGDSTVKSIDKAAYFGGEEAVIQCAGSCPWSGDSGGPIIRDGKVVGDLSWSYSYGHDVNATAGYPATYLHADWIQKTTGIAPDQAPNQPFPSQPAPDQPGPGQPSPSQPAPSQPGPGQPQPTRPVPWPTGPGNPGQPQPTRPPRPTSWPTFPGRP